MPERRQAFRQEPIEVDLGNGRVISVGPLLWEDRNRLGDEIVHQHTEELNEALKIFVEEDQAPRLEARLGNKLKDPFAVLRIGLDEKEYEKVVDKKLYPNQLTQLLVTALEVNELGHLKPLVDPNSQTPAGIGGIISLLRQTEDDATPKTESGQDSSPGDLNIPSSSDTPTPSLVAS